MPQHLLKLLIAATFFLTSSHLLLAQEVNKGLVIIDNEPWKTSWIQDSDKSWQLVSWFNKAKLTTYFKKGPTIGLGVEKDNLPLKQELYYFPTNKTYTSKKMEFEQWPDGARAHTFLFEVTFNVDGQDYTGFTTAIIQEVDSKKDEIRYAYFFGKI